MADRSTFENKKIEYFKSNIENLIMMSEEYDSPHFSEFLDENEEGIALSVLAKHKNVKFSFYGGYQNSERKILCVSNSEIDTEMFPITAVKIYYNEQCQIKHSDILGSLMGLKIKRNTIGDIVVHENSASVFLLTDMTNFIISNLNKIGIYNVSCEIAKLSELNIVKKFEKIEGTVASLRLDCILSLIMKTSRSKAIDYINMRNVMINHIECTNTSRILKPEDIISVRKYGRYLLTDNISKTKKDRLHIQLNRSI